MDPKIRNFEEIERSIKEHPHEANAIAKKWNEFAKNNPEVLSFNSSEKFYAWVDKHPEKHIDPEVWVGKEIIDAYYYLRRQEENPQAQNKDINQFRISPPLLDTSFLSLMFSNQPKTMQDDRTYLQIANGLQKKWLANNPGKDFWSKEGIDYLYGSLDDKNFLSLHKEAEKQFRENPQNAEKIGKYEKEKTRIYKNPQDDPSIRYHDYVIWEHAKARYYSLKKTDPSVQFDSVLEQIKNKTWEKFTLEHPQKAEAYAQKHQEIRKAYELIKARPVKEETSIQEQLEDYQKTSGKEIKYVEKTHRPEDISLEEATRRLDQILKAQSTQEQERVYIPEIQKETAPPQFRRFPSISRRPSRLSNFFNRGANKGIGKLNNFATNRFNPFKASKIAKFLGKQALTRAGSMLLAASSTTLPVIIVILIIFVLTFFIVGFTSGIPVGAPGASPNNPPAISPGISLTPPVSGAPSPTSILSPTTIPSPTTPFPSITITRPPSPNTITQIASAITSVLQKSYDADLGIYLFNVKPDEPSVYYWCTYLIVDSYNKSGFTGLDRNAHGAVVIMKSFFANTSGYRLLSPSTPVEQLRGGDVIFFEGAGQHVSLINWIDVDQNGNGVIHTYESNNIGTQDVVFVRNHYATKAQTTSRLYSITGFGQVSI